MKSLFALLLLAVPLFADTTNRFDPLYVLTNAGPREVRFRLIILPVEQLQTECHAIWLAPDRWYFRLAEGQRLTAGPLVPGEIVALRNGKHTWHAYYEADRVVVGVSDGSVEHPVAAVGDLVLRRVAAGLMPGMGDLLPGELTFQRGAWRGRKTNGAAIEIVSHSADSVESLVKGQYRHRDTITCRCDDGRVRSVVHQFARDGGWQPSQRIDYDEFTWAAPNTEWPDVQEVLHGVPHRREVIYDGRGEQQRIGADGKVLFSQPMDLSEARVRFLAGIVAKCFAGALVLALAWVAAWAAYSCWQNHVEQIKPKNR
jgi:hypothetical protein